MFMFVVLSLFSAWQWTDATHEISMGLEFHRAKQEMMFADLDGDGDEDMISYWESNTEHYLQAFENTTDEEGNPLWKENPVLIHGIESEDIVALGAADLKGDGVPEIVVRYGDGIVGYENLDTSWVPDLSLFADLEEPIPMHHDFADVDADGDADMLGGWGTSDMDLRPAVWWNTGTPEAPSWDFDSAYMDIEVHTGIEHPAWIDWNSDDLWDVLLTAWNFTDPPPYHSDIGVYINQGSAHEPIWDLQMIDGWVQPDELTILDYNQDQTEDILIVSEWDEGYIFLLGERFADSISYDFSHPRIWGGIQASYAAAADLTSDGIPELAGVQHIFHMDIWGPGYNLPHVGFYSSVNESGTQWQRSERTYPPYTDETRAHLQYVDYNGDGLTDYILTRVTYYEGETEATCEVYLNEGISTQPQWPEDGETLEGLPSLFPACFLDIDGDGDKDVIGESTADYEDSTVVGYINTGTDEEPAYEPHHDFVTGLPSYGLSFLSPGDLTDNQIDLPDLAVNVGGQGLLAYFNTGQDNPRWQEHEDVFADIEGDGNPALCDADADGDLDLYLVQGGRLHFYYNQSTGGVTEKPSATNAVSIRYSERGARISLALSRAVNATLRLYDVSGRKAMTAVKPTTADEVTFTVSEIPGVYFYNINAGEKTHTGKLVLF